MSCTNRLSLPRKPNLTLANIGGEDGYFTMGSRWKASHIKLFVWWVAKESEQLARDSTDPLFNEQPHQYMFSFNLLVANSLKPLIWKADTFFGVEFNQCLGESHRMSFLGPTSHQDPLLRVLAACAFGLQRSCEVMDLAGAVLTEMEAGEVHECLSVHLRAYFWLAAFFYQRIHARCSSGIITLYSTTVG